eukprot:7757682-Lingulodinium_polyedra.AAC.1
MRKGVQDAHGTVDAHQEGTLRGKYLLTLDTYKSAPMVHEYTEIKGWSDRACQACVQERSVLIREIQ